ncbi:hypothetical protein [Vagococcus lutrae]|uniref:hypothetical protein n=1 Tax=Vagococcus lutrae TaxID=81947 RepID=UPI00289F16B8|nr:hypothetical protein [Vagococcus lutrae]
MIRKTYLTILQQQKHQKKITLNKQKKLKKKKKQFTNKMSDGKLTVNGNLKLTVLKQRMNEMSFLIKNLPKLS